jgi:hypothetical protein
MHLGLAVNMSNIPFELFELAAHLSFSLAQVARRGWQNAAFQVHLFAATTRVVRCFVLLDIAADLARQYRVLQVMWRGSGVGARTFCCLHSTQALRLGVVIVMGFASRLNGDLDGNHACPPSRPRFR